ncbi:MAG TPA: CTP synthase [Phycisphaerales bacterium]|nr:CTP synthase [Phycisphaerales bacterium]
MPTLRGDTVPELRVLASQPRRRDPRREERSADAPSLASTANESVATEFYSPIPKGYVKGRTKYVVVIGTVMSGLGKGIFASSVAKTLKDKGMCVAPIKLEGYLNIDAGTLNPYRHGEVFVLDDGTECDMDLGSYERILDQNMGHRNYITSGRLFTEILLRERRGSYLGRDVQMIPHVTGEVKKNLRELAMIGEGGKQADVVFVEVGGTAGDYENGFYIEALRELAFEEGPGSTCFVALTYVIEPKALGEQKSKAAQLGIKRLMEAGIQPHIIACRASHPVSEMVRQKIAMFSNVPLNRVMSMHDRPSIYTIPDELRAEGLDREILSILDLHNRVSQSHEDRARERWQKFIVGLTRTDKKPLTIGITGKYTEVRDAYASIDKALEHCGAHLGADIKLHWLETTDIETPEQTAEALAAVDGIIVPGGFGKRGVEGKINSVRHSRETGLPYLGICLGFQVAVIEFARNVLGIADASSQEFDEGGTPVICELPEQKEIEGLGGSMRLGAQDVAIEPGSLAAHLYGSTSARERFRHRYEVDPQYIERFTEAGLVFSGKHPKFPIMQILELPQSRPDGDDRPTHPYFIGMQYHPELTSRPLRPQPVFMGLIAAALVRRHGQDALGSQRRWLRSMPDERQPA